MLHRSYIAFDVETTGLSPETDSIIELGAVRFEDGKPAAEFNSLVNAGVSISEAATKVNHIINQMLNSASGEDEVYPKLLEFLGVASSGKIILCAHNASFDFRFLANTLRRLGYDGNYLYVDTLNLSRKYIKGLENYKQGTIEAYLGLSNSVAHRAVSDAKICGEILSRILIELDEEMNEQRKTIEKITPSDEELEICAYIQKIISANGENDTSWLRYKKNSSNYIDVSCLYTMLKFKVAKKGKYIIVEKNAVEGLELTTEKCTDSEGGNDYVRVFFEALGELDVIAGYIQKCYKDCYKSMQSYLGNGDRARKSALECIEILTIIEDDRVEELIQAGRERLDNNKEAESEKFKEAEQKQREKEEKKRAKELEKQKKAENSESNCETKRTGRGIIQLDDEGTVINEFDTIAAAVRETGVNSKSIRDAAKGVQKHAGGFCWKYKEK